MSPYKYIVKSRAQQKIRSFYQNVGRKYKHTYDAADFKRNVFDALKDIYRIENGLLRRDPTLARWKDKGYNMANTDKWYYAYTFDGETVTVVDACHSQNMHE